MLKQLCLTIVIFRKVFFIYSFFVMAENKRTLELSEDLYNALQELKEIFSQLTGQNIEKDEEVIGILVSGFLDSIRNIEDENEKNW